MAGMPAIAVVARGTVVAASLAVIVAVGGRALLVDPKPVAATSQLAAVDASPSPSAAAALVSVDSPAAATSSPAAVEPTTITLQQVTRVDRAPRRGHITLRGDLANALTREPVEGRLTLWRRTTQGRWKPVITDRPTSSAGLVLLDVVQSAGRSTYRLTVDADGAHAAATSPSVTVRR